MDYSEDGARAAAIARIDAVPTLLKVLCEMTGLGFAAVAGVEGKTWTAYAVRDNLSLGVQPGDELSFMASLGFDSRWARLPIVFEEPGMDPAPGDPTLRSIKSFVSMPIILDSGRQFGTLCALDPTRTSLRKPCIVSMFKEFAALIASQLEQNSSREREQSALLDERATNELREQFIAILGHDLRNPLHAVFAGGELLERRLSDPAQRMIVSRMKNHVRRIVRQIVFCAALAKNRTFLVHRNDSAARLSALADRQRGRNSGILREDHDGILATNGPRLLPLGAIAHCTRRAPATAPMARCGDETEQNSSRHAALPG